MTKKNRYSKRAKISEAKFRVLLKLFCVDLGASQISKVVGLNRNTVNRYIRAIRVAIAKTCEKESPFSGEVEVDESYFGPRRVKGKRGRGSSQKRIVFGIFKRNGSVYTEIVPDCSRPTLQAVIRGKVSLDSVIHSDRWRGYNGLVDLGYKKHLRVDHSSDEFVSGTSHINGIEGFWGYAKMRLARFRGMTRSTFYLHLKECEFRYNYRDKDIYKILLKYFRKYPLS
jgi:transposase